MKIRRLTAQCSLKFFQGIADLHIAEIHHGLLPLLGTDSLGLLYHSIACLQGSGVWIIEDNGRLLGFLAGCADTRRIFLSVLKARGMKLLSYVNKDTLSAVFLRKLPAILRYPFRRINFVSHESSIAGLPKAELLAMAVNPSVRGRGLGKLLVETLEREFLCRGIISAYHVKTNSEEKASNNFYRSLGFQTYGTVHHHDLILNIYVKKL
jgi:ribosomal protein S18 acetylase RimI-like enzyme